MKSIFNYSVLALSLLLINLFVLSGITKADNPNIQLLGPVVNGDPWPFDYPCGSTVQFSVDDIFELYIDVTNSDYTCPVTLETFFNPPSAASLVSFFPPLPMTGDPGATLKTHLVFSSSVTTTFQIKFRARDCRDTSYCFLDFDWVLPAELTSFVSVIHGNNVDLKWTTSSEENNERFEIERSVLNSHEWNRIGAVKGAGNSSQPVSYSFTDRGLNTGNYSYRLKQIDFNGNYEYHELTNYVSIGLPGNFLLYQNFPNPFNPSTQINFEIPVDGNVNISVYDNSGKLVSVISDGYRQAGYYTVNFSATNLSSGIYFYRMESDRFIGVKKMTLIK